LLLTPLPLIFTHCRFHADITYQRHFSFLLSCRFASSFHIFTPLLPGFRYFRHLRHFHWSFSRRRHIFADPHARFSLYILFRDATDFRQFSSLSSRLIFAASPCLRFRIIFTCQPLMRHFLSPFAGCAVLIITLFRLHALFTLFHY